MVGHATILPGNCPLNGSHLKHVSCAVRKDQNRYEKCLLSTLYVMFTLVCIRLSNWQASNFQTIEQLKGSRVVYPFCTCSVAVGY